MNLKNIKGFLALYEQFLAVYSKSELARLMAIQQGRDPADVPEAVALKARIEAVYAEAERKYGVKAHYLGLIGREVKRIVEA